MYAWIWGHLPGPTAVRVLIAVALVAAIVTLLFVAVFPWLQQHLPFGDVTVGAVALFLRPQ